MNGTSIYLLGVTTGVAVSALFYKTVVERRIRTNIYQECYNGILQEQRMQSDLHLSQAENALNN